MQQLGVTQISGVYQGGLLIPKGANFGPVSLQLHFALLILAHSKPISDELKQDTAPGAKLS